MKQPIEQLSALKESVAAKSKEHVDVSRELFKEKCELELVSTQIQIDDMELAKNLQNFITEYEVITRKYNETVDPFNEVKDFMAANKDETNRINKMFLERNKDIDNLREELRKEGKARKCSM